MGESRPSVERGWKHCKRESTALTSFLFFFGSVLFLGRSISEHGECGKHPHKISQDSKWKVSHTCGICSLDHWRRWTWEPLETQSCSPSPDLVRQNLQWAKFKSWRKRWTSPSLPWPWPCAGVPFKGSSHLQLSYTSMPEYPGSHLVQVPAASVTDCSGLFHSVHYSKTAYVKPDGLTGTPGKWWLIAVTSLVLGIRFGRHILFLWVSLKPGIGMNGC